MQYSQILLYTFRGLVWKYLLGCIDFHQIIEQGIWSPIQKPFECLTEYIWSIGLEPHPLHIRRRDMGQSINLLYLPLKIILTILSFMLEKGWKRPSVPGFCQHLPSGKQYHILSLYPMPYRLSSPLHTVFCSVQCFVHIWKFGACTELFTQSTVKYDDM